MFNMTTHATTQLPQTVARQAYQTPVIRRFGNIGELTLSRGCNGRNDGANQGNCSRNNRNQTRV